ncbi:MAG TPA: AMP-binding protein [Candidatus Acidoferrum sp.]|nr:AMP-binding protein [Candidatus Acidoferrum sp.]
MGNESLLSFVANYAAHGAEVAVRQRVGYRMESWSYGQIAEQANRFARELQSRGVQKGDSVLIWGANSAEWFVVFLGCLLCGVVIVPLDESSSPQFVARVASEVDAKLLIKGGENQQIASIPSISFDSLCTLIARHDSSPYPSPPLSRTDTLEIIFTSGTTAEPRGVVISHGNVLANIEPMEREIQKYLRYEKLFHPLRFLNLLPLSHVFGQMLGLFIPPLLGATVVFMNSLRPADLSATIKRQRVSVLVAVPRFIESLQRHIERQQEAKGRIEKFEKSFGAADGEHFLRRWWRFRSIHAQLGWKFWAFISGGAALPEPAEKFWNRLGYAVIQGYGMTETTSLISLNHPFRSAQGSIGKVFPGMEVRVEENGEILVRGENVAASYRSKGAVQSLAESDGWFRTGDVAQRDGNGRLYFKGRTKSVIVTSSGMNVYPEDLEKALRIQPHVRDCVVIGIEREGNSEPCALLLMNGSGSSSTEAAIAVDRANQSLAEYQKVRRWFIWPENDFPRTATQKPILPRIREFVSSVASGTSKAASNGDSLAALVSRITGRAVPSTANEASLEADLQLSSLDRVELMSILEERYQVDLNEAKFQDVATIQQIEKLIATGAPSTVEHVYPAWPQSKLVTALRFAVYYLLARPATYLLAAPRVRGREHLRSLRGPVLVVSNHVTYLDIAWILPALPARFRNRLATAMGGERLARMRRPSKNLNWFERCLEHVRYYLASGLFNVFPLPQKSGFLQSFAFAGSLADRRWNILIFPEGQTTTDGAILPFRSGIGLLVKQLNIPVVPMHLSGLYELKKTERILARPGQVQVTIGAPLQFAVGQDADEITAEIEGHVRALQSV